MTNKNYQKAKGNNIIQAGGDIRIEIPQPVNTANLIYCPVSEYPVSGRARECPACGLLVTQYFVEIQEDQLRTKQIKLMLITSSLFALFVAVLLHFTTPDFQYKKYFTLGEPAIIALAITYRCLIRKFTGRW